MTDTALLVIDVQQSFEHRPCWSDRELPAFRENLNALIAACAAKRIPVLRILHVEDSGVFALASGHVKPMTWLRDTHDAEFHKHVHNAFTDTQLDGWLKERRIGRVIISGIRTEQCCETTARVASDLGYKVDYVTDATLTFPMQHNGKTFTPSDIKERTELVLRDRFATIKTTAECIASLESSK